MNHHAYRTGSRVNQSPSEHVMARPLDGVRAKIARAKVHAQEADLICKEIANQASREIFSEPDGDDTKLVFKIGSIPQIPLSLSTIIGDSLNNNVRRLTIWRANSFSWMEVHRAMIQTSRSITAIHNHAWFLLSRVPTFKLQ